MQVSFTELTGSLEQIQKCLIQLAEKTTSLMADKNHTLPNCEEFEPTLSVEITMPDKGQRIFRGTGQSSRSKNFSSRGHTSTSESVAHQIDISDLVC